MEPKGNAFKRPILLNCDMGESWYDEIIGQDKALMPHIDACNLACGVHGGDPRTMKRAIALAIEHNVKIGAHPSLPGRSNFGREPVDLPPEELKRLIFDQVEHLQTATQAAGQQIYHLKPHGALYHLAAAEEKEAAIVVAAALEFGINQLFGPPHSLLEAKAKAAGLHFYREGFVDRAYENGRELRSRKLPGAVHFDAERVARQAREMVIEKCITDFHGYRHTIQVETLCIHGDHPGALAAVLAVRSVFQ